MDAEPPPNGPGALPASDADSPSRASPVSFLRLSVSCVSRETRGVRQRSGDGGDSAETFELNDFSSAMNAWRQLAP